MVNQVGANDSLIFDGRSFAVMADGEVFAQAKSSLKICWCSRRRMQEVPGDGAIEAATRGIKAMPRRGTDERRGMRWCWGRGIICVSAGSEGAGGVERWDRLGAGGGDCGGGAGR